MTLFSIPFILGWLVVGFATNVIMMCIGRFVTGFCGGVFSLCSPLYIGESVSSNIRGMLMNSFQLMLVTGILFTYVVGTYVPWKTLTLISAAVPLLFLVFVPFIPESPRYLLKKGHAERAHDALSWLFGPADAVKQMAEQCNTDDTNSKASFKDLLKPVVLKPLAVSLTLMVLEQASAFNVVIFYCVDIFAQTGTGLDSYWSSIIVAIVQVLATVAGTFFVDKAGRRILLIWSEFFMGISFVALGAFFYIKMTNQDHIPSGLGWLPLVSVLVFIIAFSFGIGPLSWTVMGEILHPDVKGLCSGIATAFVWFSAFVVTKIYQTLVAAVGIHWSFWIFASVSLIGTVIVYVFVPETKGKTLEEIQQLFSNNSKRKPSNSILAVSTTSNIA
ncbi:Facilitated trehalose transporter Tret1-2 [Orchesella cincta]|uniref:Facilitated trehalose transporter Tret1-2 n=1 Tax=Orchesella cincta TaxID=48709 RepID=A0A1D2MT76_ORCCI|nr:Facilitated trehalose transporter Tret1-2 [Orchesella cincta]